MWHDVVNVNLYLVSLCVSLQDFLTRHWVLGLHILTRLIHCISLIMLLHLAIGICLKEHARTDITILSS